MKQSEETRQERTAKNTRKVKTKTRQQGRKKKRDRERQREVKEAKENERETRKGDTEKWTKITLFQGEKQCFRRKTPKPPKKIKKVEGQLPKNTCAMRRCPQSQEECEQKRKTPKEKQGDVKRTTWGLRKRGQKKNRKRRKNPPSSKRALFCSPKVLPWKPNFDKISNIEPCKIATRGKIILRTGPQTQAFSTRQKGSKRYKDAKSFRNPLFCSVSRVSLLYACVQKTRVEKTWQHWKLSWETGALQGGAPEGGVATALATTSARGPRASQSHQDQTPVAKREEKKAKPYTRPPIRQTNWMTRKEASPMLQNAPRSFQPSASQGGGIGIHGSSPRNLGRCRQGQIGPRVREDCISGRQRPRLSQRSPSRTGTRPLRTHRWHNTKEPSQPFPTGAALGQSQSPGDGA